MTEPYLRPAAGWGSPLTPAYLNDPSKRAILHSSCVAEHLVSKVGGKHTTDRISVMQVLGMKNV